MNARDEAGVVHRVFEQPRPHAVNPEHVVAHGFTHCMASFTWKTGPRYLPNHPEGRFMPTEHFCTCVRCLWALSL